ncbi:MAG: hypothetical protein OEN56_01900 [Gemmatimonadota bacterium]|nr:hypothetical protein [Gemmatimonadota bacterium]
MRPKRCTRPLRGRCPACALRSYARWAACGLTLMAAAEIGSAQEPLPLLSVDLDLADYGLQSAEELRRGRVSVAYAPEGTRLAVYYLRDTPIPPRPTPPDPPPTPDPDPRPEIEARETALWVWSTAEILRDAEERSTFLDFVESQGITRVFLYLAAKEGERASAGYIPFSSDEMGPFLAELRARGALAYALDGDRDYVLEENHAGVFRTIRRLVEHNRSVSPDQRFHGVRYDIEPYLASGFQGLARQKLLDGYVTLLAGVAEIAAEGDLRVAVDIPLWFDAPDEETGEPMLATLEGRRAPLIEHIMALVDDIAIMDYRTDAFGSNGALAHAYDELRLGEQMDVDVFIGVETVRLVDEDLHTFFGPVREGLPTHAEARWIVLEASDSGAVRLWLVDGEAALSELREKTADADLLRHWPAGRPTRVSADSQSFYNHGVTKMRDVTAEIVRRVVASPAFAGLAFHDYRGLKRLLDRR